MGYDDPQGSTKTPAVHKNKLSETDIRAKFITPALVSAGWSEEEPIYREYTLRPGRVVVRGRAAGRDSKSVLRADYVLFLQGQGRHSPGGDRRQRQRPRDGRRGMAQAIRYAELLNVPFCLLFRQLRPGAGRPRHGELAGRHRFRSGFGLSGERAGGAGGGGVREAIAQLEVREPSARYAARLDSAKLTAFNELATATDGGKRLRQLICSLAVRGRLLPQNSHDESAIRLIPILRDESKKLLDTKRIPKERVSSACVTGTEIPLPPLAEQHRIVARVEELRHLCAQLRERLIAAQRTQGQLADALVAEVG
ncbi:MAG: hypothetical protein H0U56_11300 [Methylibium sp.]|nr:hypothetical protein [Methylibium sp.]MBA2723458.1 hypothetical protein [Methylibium sp.]MBA3589861.1 hypothetical protein [Methylibium sp.]